MFMSIVNSSIARQPRTHAIVVNGHPVVEVYQFTFLGSKICRNGGSDADVDCRVSKAKGALEYCQLFEEIVHSQTALG